MHADRAESADPARATVTGALSGLLLGVGMSFLNLAVLTMVLSFLAGTALATLGAFVGFDQLLDEELLRRRAAAVAGMVAAAVVLLVASILVAWRLLGGAQSQPQQLLGRGLAGTAITIAVGGFASTAFAWPLQILASSAGDDLVPAVLLAVVLGLAGAPVGALAFWLVARAMGRGDRAGRDPGVELVHVDFGGSSQDAAAQPR